MHCSRPCRPRALFIIAIAASLLTRFLALSGAGDYLSDLIVEAGAHGVPLMIGIKLICLVLGMFLEPLDAMLLTLPIVLPVIDSTGFSLVWFGVLLKKFLEIGMINPPIGLKMYVIKGVVGDLAATSRIFYGAPVATAKARPVFPIDLPTDPLRDRPVAPVRPTDVPGRG